MARSDSERLIHLTFHVVTFKTGPFLPCQSSFSLTIEVAETTPRIARRHTALLYMPMTDTPQHGTKRGVIRDRDCSKVVRTECSSGERINDLGLIICMLI